MWKENPKSRDTGHICRSDTWLGLLFVNEDRVRKEEASREAGRDTVFQPKKGVVPKVADRNEWTWWDNWSLFLDTVRPDQAFGFGWFLGDLYFAKLDTSKLCVGKVCFQELRVTVVSQESTQ